MGIYRENAIAIESEANDSFGGLVYYVTMQITLPILAFTRNERNSHCDVLHFTPDSRQTRPGWRDRSDPDVAIKAYSLEVIQNIFKMS